MILLVYIGDTEGELHWRVAFLGLHPQESNGKTTRGEGEKGRLIRITVIIPIMAFRVVDLRP